MFHILQSNDTNILVDHLLSIYKQQATHAASVFETFTVIVPSMVLGDWLNKTVASKVGVSTLFTAQFWGQYQWQMIQKVLQIDAKINPKTALQVPEVAVLSGSVMRWRLFGFLSSLDYQSIKNILYNPANPLHFLLQSLCDKEVLSELEHSATNPANANHKNLLPEYRIWQVCEELASVYVRYLTQRPEWLRAWSAGAPLPKSVLQMIQDKDIFGERFGEQEATPDWLVAQYESLELLLRYLWQQLFAQVYDYREKLEARFWEILDAKRGANLRDEVLQALPKQLYLFTVQQIPLLELQFLKRLSLHLDIYLFHFNQSKMFWADIVDKNWLATQKIIQPSAVYYKDSGHALLSRLGKESRETFAMLVDMSGGDFYYEKSPENIEDIQQPNKVWQTVWQDEFSQNFVGDGLLTQLKKDILFLQDNHTTAAWLGDEMLQILQQKHKPKSTLQLPDVDTFPSLSIHACHNLRRQLEIARTLIARYLNEKNSDGSMRQLSDVVVYLPDVESAKELIELVFDDSVGMDGLRLPAKITGVTNKRIEQLMQAIGGFYALLGVEGGGFYKEEVYEWLLNPMLYPCFDLSFEDMLRACQLLDMAGFRRGFDARHLQQAQSLDEHDTDYRYCFSYALDRLVAGFLVPDTSYEANPLFYPFAWQADAFCEASLALEGVTLADKKIVETLCVIYTALSGLRDEYLKVDLVQTWLNRIESEVIDRYFVRLKQSAEMRAIFEAKNSIAASLRANRHYQKYQQISQGVTAASVQDDIYLSLKFVLDSLEKQVISQAVSSEPSGMITFARFGALRSIPFGLTVMLDMNLSAFPRQDKHSRMDLMRAGLRRRGDRLLEDDDNGAFLDALLCSRDACAIFYTGVGSDGVTELLPASAVSELIEYLKFGVDWQADLSLVNAPLNTDETTIATLIMQMMPVFIEEYLVTKHSALGFEKSAFYLTTTDKVEIATENSQEQNIREILKQFLMNRLREQKQQQQKYLPPAPIFAQMRQILDEQEQYSARTVIELPTDAQYQDIAQAFARQLHSVDGQSHSLLAALLASLQVTPPSALSLEVLIAHIQKPMHSFLRGKLSFITDEEPAQLYEPRSLDGLDNYSLHNLIIDAMSQGVFDGLMLEAFVGAQWWREIQQDKSVINRHQNLLLNQFYANVLPAGSIRLEGLDDGVRAIGQQVRDFQQQMAELGLCNDTGQVHYSSMIRQTQERQINITLGASLTLSAQLPLAAEDDKPWLMLLPVAMKAKHVLRIWLWHLAWQVARQTTQADVQAQLGMSLCSFHKSSDELNAFGLKDASVLRLSPVLATQAQRILANFIAFALLAECLPLPLSPLNMLTYLAEDSQEADWSVVLKKWLESEYEGAREPVMQLVLGERALEEFLRASVLIEPLLSEFRESLQV